MNALIKLVISFMFLALLISCQKEKSLPTIETLTASSITSSSASVGGNVSLDGGGDVTTRGICWSTNQNPTTADNKISSGGGLGTFSVSISSLSSGVTYYARAYATNIVGTNYGSQVTITTTSVIPVLTTIDILAFSSTTATSGGIITSDGGAAIIARGVCWSTNQNPTTTNDKTINGSGIGIFTSAITNLTPGTTYYLRAYATNNTGTAYGDEKTFSTTTTLPVLTTVIVSEITATTANSGGNIVSDGGLDITARGVCWNTTQNPSISDDKTINGTGTGSYASPIGGLLPNTTYYLRAFATNSAGTSYGNQVSLKTLVTTPTITTTMASEITALSALSGGNVTSDGGQTVTARGICWSTNQNPTTLDSKTINGTGTGIFNGTITGLTPGTTYYVRSYATNASGTSYGNQITFSSIYTAPILTTIVATAVASTSANAGGNITHDGGKSITARGICWSTSTNPTISDSKTINGTSTGTFSGSMTGLNPNVTYYARAYATNSIGTQYGAQVSFKTPAKVTDIDGNSYNTLIIGEQTWFQENLRTTKYNDGTSILNITESSVWINNSTQKNPAFCWPNNDKNTYAIPYGALYNWYAVETSKLCPTGWHVSTDAEWTYITDLVGGSQLAGEKVKLEGTDYWTSPNLATNTIGFNAVPAGWREINARGGSFLEIGETATWWAYSSTGVWYRTVVNSAKEIWRSSTEYKWGGVSVRCVKNY